MFTNYRFLYSVIVVCGMIAGCFDGNDAVEENSQRSDENQHHNEYGSIALACLDEEFDIDSELGFIGFDSSLYPSVLLKMEQISEQPDPFIVARQMLIYGQFVQLPMLDALVPLLTVHCNYELYETSGCQIMPFLTDGKVNIKEVVKDGEKLSFTVVDGTAGKETTITYANPKYDGLTIFSVEADGEESTIEWVRLTNGTEKYVSTSSSGDVTTYTEYSDCSGTFHTTEFPDGGKKTLDLAWTSTKNSMFKLDYKACSQKSSPVLSCESGTL